MDKQLQKQGKLCLSLLNGKHLFKRVGNKQTFLSIYIINSEADRNMLTRLSQSCKSGFIVARLFGIREYASSTARGELNNLRRSSLYVTSCIGYTEVSIRNLFKEKTNIL